MIIFYSSSANGFYSMEIHGSEMPKDCIKIPTQYYNQLLIDQENGKTITSKNGYPISV